MAVVAEEEDLERLRLGGIDQSWECTCQEEGKD